MAKFLFTGAVALCVLSGTTPLYAGQSGDMFGDQPSTVTNRPWVPSDQYEGFRSRPDFFPTPAPYVRTDKDMFDSVPKPGDPGIEQHFSAHRTTPAPDGPLFQDPNGARP